MDCSAFKSTKKVNGVEYFRARKFKSQSLNLFLNLFIDAACCMLFLVMLMLRKAIGDFYMMNLILRLDKYNIHKSSNVHYWLIC